ncbi:MULTISPECIES: flagellar hook-associated protein FlgK [Tatumella]|uniref:Flagellar hook-associated protein 1 n=1 Tax=Tatumella punctata TaxID=399969 RepID=A0ABW1VPW6_9GAMM|nr:flagellar hook-associated protein FlgK [Tatumella sp. JGM130]MBS0894551.1 flagellar hook-associated protein FlgK [Tatumella sp. JGM130]
MSALINSAMSGLSAAQSALNITSVNISNYTVPGYNRQQVLLAQANSTLSGNGWYGNGVRVDGVQRQYDELVSRQLRQASAQNSAANSQFTQISGIDNLMTMDGNDLSDSFQAFFKNVQNVIDSAEDPAARQAMFSGAQSLAGQLRTLQQYLDNLQSATNNQISDSISAINNDARQIAALNKQIGRLSASGEAPNNLLDQRDQLVSDLNNITAVNVSIQDGNMVVSLPNGLSLVNGDQSTEMKAIASAADPTLRVPGYTDKMAGDVELPDKLFTGGSLAGLLKFRSEDLETVKNRLGQISVTFASRMNQVQHQGFDSEGNEGGDFFSVGSPVVFSNSKNTSQATLSASYSDTTALQASDYRVAYSRGQWTVTRLSDNQVITPKVSTDNGTQHLSFDGLDVAVSGSPAEKDSFLLKPVSEATHDFAVAIDDGSQIAAASEPGGASDNRNASAMLALQDEQMVGGRETLTRAYASMVSYVGNKTGSLQSSCTTRQLVVDQLTQRQQSVSGVNLDEEYAMLTQYQQYYIANTKVLQTADTLFNSLMSITN